MPNDEREQQFQAIARDIEQCDIGMALTRGNLRRRYARHRKACIDAIHRMNVEDGLDDVSDDDLMAALSD